MKSVIDITATNPRIYYSGTIFQVDSKLLSHLLKKYLKRDYEDEINESFKPPQKCQPYCRYHACRMAFR